VSGIQQGTPQSQQPEGWQMLLWDPAADGRVRRVDQQYFHKTGEDLIFYPVTGVFICVFWGSMWLIHFVSQSI
jgi:hypothetical protein